MAYPRKLLGEGEEIILDFNPHWTYLLRPLAWTALWLVALGALVYLLRDRGGLVLKLIVLGVIAVAWFVTAGVGFIRWRTTEYVLTTDRLIVREGIIAKKGREIPLENINDIAFSQSVIERMLGAGDLVIESAGEFGQNRYTDIPKPSEVQNHIYRQIEENRARMMRGIAFSQASVPAPAPPPQPPPPPPYAAPTPVPAYSPPVPPVPVLGDEPFDADSVEAGARESGPHPIPRQIEELARLRDQGLISENEFQAKKSELLRRM